MLLSMAGIIKPMSQRERCTFIVQANILLDVGRLVEDKIEAIVGLDDVLVR